MAILTLNRLVFGCLGLATSALAGWGAHIAYERVRDRQLVMAAGDSKSESYILAQAIKTVVERRHPDLSVEVLETAGTSQSLALLDSGKAQFALAQADVIAGAHARGEARLFDEVFQIIVPADSPVRAINDLKGKRIALSRQGEQYRSFLYLARHHDMGEADFRFVGEDNNSAAAAFARGEADALFAVRPLHTESLLRVTQNLSVRFLPIDGVSAMRLDVPAYRSAVILKASYNGTPPIPDADTPTVALDRLLLVHEDVPDYIAFYFAQVLSQDRQEIAQAIPDANDWVRQLTVSIRPPEMTGLVAAVHPGAQLYYSNQKLTFSITDILLGTLLIGTLTGLWLLAFRNLKHQRQKRYSDEFNQKMMALLEEALAGGAKRSFQDIRNDSLKLLGQAVGDLDAGNISAQAFLSSRAVWQIAYDLMRENAAAPGTSVRAGAPSELQTAPAPPAPSVLPEFRTVSSRAEESGGPKDRRWSMWRDG